MNKIPKLVSILLIFVSVSCDSLDKITQGCSIRVSGLVFLGRFESEDIECIRIIHGARQKRVYPLPDWEKSKNMIEINDPVFFKDFKSALLSSKRAKDPPEVIHLTGNIQIQVVFKEGPGAYLFGEPRKQSLAIEPMFEHDSYGITNESLFDLVNNALAISPSED